MREKIEQYIKTWENRCYYNGVPDSVEIEISHLVPSYKKIAIAILKNDIPLKSLGFTPKKSEYYDILKKMELAERGIRVNAIQLRLF